MEKRGEINTRNMYKVFVISIILLFFLFIFFINSEVNEEEVYLNGELGSQEPVDWGFEGDWEYDGYLQYDSFAELRDGFLDSALNYEIIDTNGLIDVVIKDKFGADLVSEVWISFDKQTGHCDYSFKFDLPLGLKKTINYSIELNGNKNLNEYFNISEFVNSTLRDLLFDLMGRGINISFVGEHSNLTIYTTEWVNGRPKIQLDYEKKEGWSMYEDMGGNETLLAYDSIQQINKSHEKVNLSDLEEINEEIMEEIKILDPNPLNKEVKIEFGNLKRFSIGNKDYEKIYWYLNGLIVKESSVNYQTDVELPVGKHELKVEITKEGKKVNYSWEILVEKIEQPKEELGVRKIMFYLIIIVFIVIILIGIWLFMANKSNENSQEQGVFNLKS